MNNKMVPVNACYAEAGKYPEARELLSFAIGNVHVAAGIELRSVSPFALADSMLIKRNKYKNYDECLSMIC